MIENQLMVLGPGLHELIAFNDAGCSSCLGLGSSSDRSRGTGMCPRLQRGTLEMEVRETQSYTAVVRHTGQATMDGAAHWATINMASKRR